MAFDDEDDLPLEEDDENLDEGINNDEDEDWSAPSREGESHYDDDDYEYEDDQEEDFYE
ncbi:MAG: highly acidic protein [Helicobacteraceae bacterium]|nr:highly acidic protein [Helicobacteraceae bacterium]